MEVHAHSHTARKKWTHYFWEFFMLFLAVVAGFFVENQREHIVEHQREKQYIRSLFKDVTTDSLNIITWVNRYADILKNCDTVLSNFDSIFEKKKIKFLGHFFAAIAGYPDFIYTDRTMQQLKNSGGLRLIRDQKAVDSIIDYDSSVRDLLIEETAINGYYEKLNDLTFTMINGRELFLGVAPGKSENPLWINREPEKINRLFNLVFLYRGSVKGFIEVLNNLKSKGMRLTRILQQQYHLE